VIEIKVPEGESASITVAGYTFLISKQEDGQVAIDRWIDGQHREIKLDPVEDAKPQPDPRDVPLNRNLTELRLPEQARKANTIRCIVWERDADTGARSILDIVEGSRKDIIRFFNRKREDWASTGGSETARIEVVPDEREREGIWA
jgi:hypothetical protein